VVEIKVHADTPNARKTRVNRSTSRFMGNPPQKL
jgi:hypothetical protein